MDDIDAIVAHIDYDFNSFAIEDFTAWVAKQRGKPIVLQPWAAMPRGVVGLWLSSPGQEHIYYYDQLPPTLKLVTLLHELAHIYLNHSTLTVTSALKTLLDLVYRRDEVQVQAMARDIIFDRDSGQEREAELMALLLLERILKHRRSSRSEANSPGTDYLRILGVS